MAKTKSKKSKSKEDIEEEILKEAKEEAEKETSKKEKKQSKTEKKEEKKKSSDKDKDQKTTPRGKKKASKGKKQSFMDKAQSALKESEEISGGKRILSKPILERIYTVSLKNKKVSSNQRTARAVRDLNRFVQNHTDSDEIIFNQELNEHIWERGPQKPPKSVRIKVEKDEDGQAFVSLYK